MLGLREKTMSTFILFYFTCAHAGGFTDVGLQRMLNIVFDYYYQLAYT